MHPSRQLYQLQTLDLERDARHRRLQQVIASLNEPEALRTAAAALTGAQAQVATARARRKDLELEVQTLDAKIANAEERLYSGRVRNPKELSDLQNDAASMRRHHTTLDDRLLEAMIALEDAEQVEGEARTKSTAVQAEWQTHQRALLEEKSRLAAEIAAMTEQRHQQMTAIEAKHVDAYQQLRRTYVGQAVARIEEGTCVTCGVELSDRLLVKASHSDDLSFCGNCERILLIE
jgi:predicted  nucleic acid-binding Zn-ribbon protein